MRSASLLACLLLVVFLHVHAPLASAASVNPVGPPYSFSFTNFSSFDPFELVSTAGYLDGTIQLTTGVAFGIGAARLQTPMLVGGFDTTFTVQVSNFATGQGLEGMAFVILNSAQLYGEGLGGLGYADSSPDGQGGLEKSIAFELDTFTNPEMADPIYEHISVHSLGALPNSAAENTTARLCGPYINIPPIATAAGAPYTVRVVYMPPYAWAAPGTPAMLTVYVGGIADAIGVCALPASIESLVAVGSSGLASLLFTASSGAVASDIEALLSWSYTFLGAVAPNVSVATGPSVATAGVNITFSVQAYDQFGARYGVDGDAVTAVLPSGDVVPGVPTGNGGYAISVALVASGTRFVHVLMNSVPVLGSPFNITVSAAGVAPENCRASNIGTGVAGVPQPFTVRMFDAFGNPVTLGSLVVTLGATPNVARQLVCNYLPGVGEGNQYGCTVAITKAGSYAVNVRVGGVAINNAAVQTVGVVAGPYNYTEVYGAGLSGAVAGVAARFALQLYDVYGNPILVGAENVHAAFVAAQSAGPGQIFVVNNFNGTYFVTYSAERAGLYTINVMVGAGATAPSQVVTPTVVTTNVPDPANTRILGSGARGQFPAGSTQFFRVGLRDEYNNTLATAANAAVTTLLVATARPTVPLAMPAPTFITGQAVVQFNISYTLTAAEGYYLSVLVNGVAIAVPFDIQILPGPVTAASTTAVSMSGGSLSSTLTGRSNRFVIDLRDAYGNPISGGANVSLAARITGPQSFSVAFAEVSPSQYAASYSIDKIGRYSLWITINGANIDGSPFAIRVEWAYTLTVVVIAMVALALLIITIFIVCVARRKSKRKRYARI